MFLQKKIYLFLTIVVFLNLCLIIFLIYPLFNNIKRNSEKIVLQRQSLFSLEAKTKNLEEAKIFYQRIRPDLEKTKDLFVDPTMPVDFITFLERLSQETNTAIAIFPPTQGKTQEDIWPHFFLQLNLNSSSPNFLKFLEKLENSPYLIEVVTLDIKKMSKGETKTLETAYAKDITAALTLKVFSKR